MNTTTNYSKVMGTATLAGVQALKEVNDDGYGCGSSFVTVKWGPFVRWAKQHSLVQKDSYYGWILDTEKRVSAKGTLAQETYNRAFAKSLSEQGVHAFCHTYLT